MFKPPEKAFERSNLGKKANKKTLRVLHVV